MYKGTTPTYVFTTESDIDLTRANEIYVTFSDRFKNELFTKSGDDLIVLEKQVGVYLTQCETLSLPNGRAYVQLNWTYDGGKRMCSNVLTLSISQNLLEHEL